MLQRWEYVNVSAINPCDDKERQQIVDAVNATMKGSNTCRFR